MHATTTTIDQLHRGDRLYWDDNVETDTEDTDYWTALLATEGEY